MPVKIDKIPSLEKYKDYIAQDGSLYVGIIATHAGFVNKNHFYYIPSKMEQSISTWVKPYNKPAIQNHIMDSEPLGRVIAAKYVDTSEDTKTLKLFLSDNDVKQELNKNIKYIQENKDKILDPSNSLGYTYLIVRITNKDAIDKILDGRYLTVSISASSNHAYCAICGADWANGEECEHEPYKGTIDDDGNLACFIAGSFEYSELSFVNSPADQNATIVDIYTEEEVNSIVNNTNNEQNFIINKERVMDTKTKQKGTEIKDSVTKEQLEKENLELKDKIAKLENEINNLKDSLKEKEEELGVVNEVNVKLTDELKEIYFTKIVDMLVSLGKEAKLEDVKKKYEGKTIDQLKDYLSLISEIADAKKEDVDNDKGKSEDKEDETKVEDNENKEDVDKTKEDIEDEFKDKKMENDKVEIPANIKAQALAYARIGDNEMAEKVINDYIKKHTNK